MATQEVRSTPEALEAIASLRSTLDGEFLTSLQTIITLGNRLSDGEIWRGQHASQFAGEWGGIQSKLNSTHEALVQLQDTIRQINANIQAAGGNA